MEAITRRIVGPPDCGLLLAIPLTRARFMDDLDPAAGRDFARHYAATQAGLQPGAIWERYRPYAELAGGVAAEAEAAGVRVVREAALPDFATLVAERPVVTLVAHAAGDPADGGAVELADGLHATVAVAERIRPDQRAIIDLTVCRSVALGEAIKRRARGCVVVMNRSEASLDFRLLVYQAIIAAIARQPVPFLDALTRVRVDLLESGRRA